MGVDFVEYHIFLKQIKRRLPLYPCIAASITPFSIVVNNLSNITGNQQCLLGSVDNQAVVTMKRTPNVAMAPVGQRGPSVEPT